MELVWMLAICLTAITVAFIIGERIDKTVFLKLKVKDPEQLQCQMEELAKQGVAFAEGCYVKKLIRGEDIPLAAKEYMKSSLELLYKTKVVDQEGILEEMIQGAMEEGIEKRA